MRTFLRKEREALGKLEKKLNAKAIVSSLIPLLEPFTTIGIYLALEDEVDVGDLLRLKQRFVVPVMQDEKHIAMCEYTRKQDLKVGRMKIQEPKTQVFVDQKDIDVLIIPILGFDENMHRLGQGGGYYDRYLQTFTGVKIGVAFEVQKSEYIPSEQHDIDMDYIVSEAQIYKKK